jgi:hypothetical protein
VQVDLGWRDAQGGLKEGQSTKLGRFVQLRAGGKVRGVV